jgi:hypothetical protein
MLLPEFGDLLRFLRRNTECNRSIFCSKYFTFLSNANLLHFWSSGSSISRRQDMDSDLLIPDLYNRNEPGVFVCIYW